MKRELSILVVALLLLTRPVSAQTSDCIATHPALTALDDATMIAAYKASFRGLYGREPSMQPGSGLDDGLYWVSVSNHFGAFGDRVCRAGWSRYWEGKLRGVDALDPSLGDQPAQFQPGAPVIVPPVPPTPTPVQGPPGPIGPPGPAGPKGDPGGVPTSTLEELLQRITALESDVLTLKARPALINCDASVSLFGIRRQPVDWGCVPKGKP